MLAVSVTWIHKYTFLHIFIRTRQSKIKLLSGKIIVSKRIHVIKEERKIKLLNPFLAEDEDEEQEIRIVKRVEDYYPEDKFSARYELKVMKQCLYFNRNYLREVFFALKEFLRTRLNIPYVSAGIGIWNCWFWGIFFSFCSNVIQSFPYVCSAPWKKLRFLRSLLITYLKTLSLEKEIAVLKKSLEKVLNFGSRNLYEPRTSFFLPSYIIGSERWSMITLPYLRLWSTTCRRYKKYKNSPTTWWT